MIASMTGYGKSTLVGPKIKLTVEIKSINSKQLDLLLRLPSIFRDMETSLRSEVGNILERGKVELSVNYENLAGELPVKVNREVVKSYKQEIEELAVELNVNPPQDWFQVIFRLPDAWTTENKEADAEEKELLRQGVIEAAQNLMTSRIKEGEGLYQFFFNKIERIREYLSLTEKFETDRVAKIREKIENQLSRLQGVEIDKGRLEQEMIFYVEKLDVTEEKQRLRSHLNYFEETLGEPDDSNVGGKGKKLGFISQEIGREINTLGSKSNDAEMQKLVVMMKDELEQVKEQVLNVL